MLCEFKRFSHIPLGTPDAISFFCSALVILYFALMALANDIAKLGTGTTFKEVSGATVSNILIPLPPLAEQERIVAKLDALLPKVQALNDL